MIYDTETRELRTNDGRFLKKLDCPVHKRWQELTVISEDDLTRRKCFTCHKVVVDISKLTDEEAIAFFRKKPKQCIHIQKGENLQTQGRTLIQPDDPCPYPRIHTARGTEEINKAVKNGYFPLVKQVKLSEKIRSWMEVYQNIETGEIYCIDDMRGAGKSAPWKRIIEPFTYDRYPQKYPIAAYLIPPYIKEGQKVFLVDLIENYVGIWGNQGHTYRLDSAYAIWKGEDFEILWDEGRDASKWIG
jgi:hypothetical protein